MTRISPATLLVCALLGGGAGYLLNFALTAARQPSFTPSLLLPVMLVLLAAGVVLVAWPVRRSIREGKRIDPFRAVRIATLARASSLLGAILTGIGAGLALFFLTGSAGGQLGSMTAIVSLVVSALILVGAALLAEYFCTRPKDPDDRFPEDSVRGAEPSR